MWQKSKPKNQQVAANMEKIECIKYAYFALMLK